MIETLIKSVLKVDRFTSDSATHVTWANVHGYNRDQKLNIFGLQNALNLAYLHLQFKKFSRGNTPGPLKREGREKEGVGQGNGRQGKIEGWVQERKSQGGKGREVPLLQILEVWACHTMTESRRRSAESPISRVVELPCYMQH
jgi:hypothetical protein